MTISLILLHNSLYNLFILIFSEPSPSHLQPSQLLTKMAGKKSNNKNVGGKTKTTRKRSSRKILDAFQIAERAENGSGSEDGGDGDMEILDGVMDARKLVKDGSASDKFIDEELDSDEALGSDDDFDILNSKFSQSIRDKKKKAKELERKKRRGEQVSDDEDSEEDEGYHSIDESKLVSLSEAWDMDDKDQRVDKEKSGDIVLDDAWESEESESEASEEGSEEEESGSDADSDSESDSDIFNNNSGEEDITLSNTFSHLKSLNPRQADKKRLVTETTLENEFNVPTGNNKLSLQDMLSVVDSSISKDAILIDSQSSKALATPLPKRIQERHDRKVAYDITKEEVSRWNDTVKQNRDAEVLKFPMNPVKSHNDTALSFRGDSAPSTELEKKIHTVLTNSSLLDDKKEATFEEIAMAKLSVEEMKRRTNELRLMRELMFRDEKRSKRIKKIKSKQYHKIKKRETLRNQEQVEGSDIESDVEDHDLKRAKERMTLKHKTQSSWAKSMIKSGLSKDAANRGELEEMLRQGEKLRTKQLGYEEGDQSDGQISDIEQDYEKDDLDGEDASRSKLGKGVLGMDFMKKAEKQKREENLKEIELMRKLEANGAFEDDAENSVNINLNQGRRVYAPKVSEGVEDMRRRIEEEVEEDGLKSLDNKLKNKYKVISEEDGEPKERATKSRGEGIINKHSKETSKNEASEDEESNPWLSGTTEAPKPKKIITLEKSSSKLSKSAAKISKSKKRSSSTRDEDDNMINVEETLKFVDVHGSEDEGEVEEDGGKMFQQRDLIQQAFAGDDVVSEFKDEKRQVAQDEDDHEEDLTMPGWGGWAGDDLRPTKKKKVVRKIDGVVQMDRRKDKNLKDVIINEKVNKKNLKYQSSGVPYPFESREQYERSLRMPVGQEWTSRDTHQRMTMPRIIAKQGTVIDPLKAPFK